jgi:hypothetical protein
MAAEQNGDGVTTQHLEPQPMVSIRATVGIAALGGTMDDGIRALAGYLRRCGARPAGPPIVRYHTMGETEADVELGIPMAHPLAGEGRITGGGLPGGPAIATWHLGAHDRLGDAYARLDAWLKARGRAPVGYPWEVYAWIDPGQYRGPASLGDPATWRTQLVQPVE